MNICNAYTCTDMSGSTDTMTLTEFRTLQVPQEHLFSVTAHISLDLSLRAWTTDSISRGLCFFSYKLLRPDLQKQVLPSFWPRPRSPAFQLNSLTTAMPIFSPSLDFPFVLSRWQQTPQHQERLTGELVKFFSTSMFLAQLLICLKRSGPSKIPPYQRDTTTMTFFTFKICYFQKHNYTQIDAHKPEF